jgi:maleylacetate reductase
VPELDFVWRDGERLVRFRPGAAAEAREALTGAGFGRYALLTTERARRSVPDLAEGAAVVLEVPPGRVDELAVELLEKVDSRLPVGLGGGRVIDVAKAIAGAGEGRCAAVPTTLSGAEMTGFHRLPAGVSGARSVRPELVVADPDLMASQRAPALAASAMNATAHAMEALYTPLANPVGDMAALRAAELIARHLPEAEPDRPRLALGALLAGYASGAAGLAVHHAVCQTIVRVAGSPHAETNAVMLPQIAALMASRAPEAMARLARALGDPNEAPEGAAGLLSKLAARSGHTRLSTLGVEEEHLPKIASAAREHRGLAMTPDAPAEDELEAVLRAAL